ncbi:MAG TPA: hypothetical protein VGR89_14740 [Puia sp.]|nr:hypothetical protein [Puia sp.]
MKKTGAVLVFLTLSLAPWACQQPITLGPQTPFQTPTPTAITTPVCGFTLISLGNRALNAGPSVIRSLADWQTFCSYPTGTIPLTPNPTPVIPAPPVDFSSQMLIVYVTPVCPWTTLQVTNVCEGPFQITVSANNVHACFNCNMGATWGSFSGIVVPQSGLPVTWVLTQVPCQMGVTPTATP